MPKSLRFLSLLALFVLTAIIAPRGNAPLTVCASGCTYTNAQLQTALDAATDGDIILVESGHTYTTPSEGYVLGKKCATPRWDCITLRTGVSAVGAVLPLSTFPLDGVRVGITYRGTFAKFTPSANNEAAIRTVYPGETGASCAAQPCNGSGWTLKWLEFSPLLTHPERAIVRFGTNKAGREWNGSNWVDAMPNGETQDTLVEVPTYLSFLQCDLHGDATLGQHQGLLLSSAATRVLNSSFRDIKSNDFETQAITGLNGLGPWDIENNYIEGSGENVMVGGADSYLQLKATVTGSPTTTSLPLTSPLWIHLDGTTSVASLSTDIYSGIFISVTHGGTEYGGLVCTFSGSTCTVSPALPVTPSAGDVVKWTWLTGGLTFRENWVYKPPAWQGNYIVKNLFELKHMDGGGPAGASLIEGNVFDYTWCCSQNMAINLKAWNQDGGDVSSTIRNLTFRKNWIRHAVRGINLTTSHAEAKPSGVMTDVTITDNLFTDLSSAWGGTLTGIQVTSGNYVDHVGSRGCVRCTFSHNTLLADTSMDGPLWFVMTEATDTNLDFVYRDNLSEREGSLPLRTYIGDPGQTPGTTSWNLATSGTSSAANNIWPDASPGTYTFSTSSFFPDNVTLQAALVSYGGCYSGTLLSCAFSGSTLYDNAGSDGRDIGADISAIKTLTDVALSGLVTSLMVEMEDFTPGVDGGSFHDLDVNDNNYGPDIETTLDTGGGSDLGWAFATEYVEYDVTAAITGAYVFAFRVASDGQGGVFHVNVDGVNRTGSITVPNTGGWQTWTTITKAGVPLTAGTHTLRFVMDTDSLTTTAVGNFNWFTFTLAPPGSLRRFIRHGGGDIPSDVH